MANGFKKIYVLLLLASDVFKICISLSFSPTVCLYTWIKSFLAFFSPGRTVPDPLAFALMKGTPVSHLCISGMDLFQKISEYLVTGEPRTASFA